MKTTFRTSQLQYFALLLCLTAELVIVAAAGAQNKPEKSFSAVITDAHGMETEVKNLLF